MPVVNDRAGRKSSLDVVMIRAEFSEILLIVHCVRVRVRVGEVGCSTDEHGKEQ